MILWTNTSNTVCIFGGFGYGGSGVSSLNDLWKFDPATTNWTWMKGSTNCEERGVYGTQGVPDSTNTPGARRYSVSWRHSDGSLWLFSGIGYGISGLIGSLNDVWKFDPGTTNWTWMKGGTTTNNTGFYGTLGVPDPANTPGARSSVGCWQDTVAAVYFFGGSGYGATGYTGSFNEMWKFDPVTTNWTWTRGPTNDPWGVYGTQGMSDAANTPGARGGHASWTDAGGAFWLFGGDGCALSQNGELNDVWQYNGSGRMALTTNALVFSAVYQGDNPTAQLINITNSGTRGFAYTNVITYSTGASEWLTVRPPAGVLALGGTTTLSNQINIAGVNAGTYFATNQITADAINSPQSVAVRLIVSKADQAITFPAITDQVVTNTVGLSAAASSGLPVSFTNLAGSPVAWQNATTITFTATGRVSIVASQAGDTNWKAAPNVTNLFQVTGTNQPSPTPPSPPTGVSASAGLYADRVQVSWNTVVSATGYEVWRSGTNESSSAALLISGISTTIYNDTSAMVGILYYYWVKASNAASVSAFSSSASGWRSSVSPGVCADYDGDGLADPAVYDEAAGTWRVRLSSAGYYLIATTLNGLGGPGWASVSADYDGDHKADPAVYQESTGTWIVLLSTADYAVRIVLPDFLGGVGYSAIPSDYDGDYKADPGVYQRINGDWCVMLSSANYFTLERLGMLGGTGYRPMAADFDGDQKADPAIYGEENGIWAAMLSSAGYLTFVLAAPFGGAGWIPVPADYDGDGLADPAVRNETTNEWIAMLSSAGYLPIHVMLVLE
jgi:N-acetylneuraminic acid mutarotase